jgi:hypothetical protein
MPTTKFQMLAPVSVRADKLLRSASKAFDAAFPKRLSASFDAHAADGEPAERRALLLALLRCLLLLFIPACLALASVATLIRHSLRKPRTPPFVPFSSSLEHALGRGSGVSIVAACNSQNAAFARAAESWLTHQSVTDVVLVVWAPDAEREANFVDLGDRIRVVRASDDGVWCASRTHNLGVSLALNRYVAIVDCETEIASLSLEALPEGVAAHAISQNVLLLDRDIFRQLGGYREHACAGSLARYRQDDDLRERFRLAGYAVHVSFAKSNLWQELRAYAVKELSHRPDLPLSVQQCRFKVLDVEALPVRWWNIFGRPLLLPRVLETVLAPEPFPASVVDAVWSHSVGRELHDSFGICWDVMIGIDEVERERLLLVLQSRQKRMKDEVASSSLGQGLSPEVLASVEYDLPRLLVVHVMHGLGNRLRALISAMAFAKSTSRQLIVIWERSPHCGAFFGELFEQELLGVSVEKLFIVNSFPMRFEQFEHAYIHDALWRDWDIYNYMPMDGVGAEKDKPIVDDPSKHIYFKSAYVMRAAGKKLSGWDMDNAQLLRLHPVDGVRAILESHLQSGGISENTVGVHIRSFGLPNESNINALKEYGIDDSEVLTYWRARSQPANFYAEMRALVAANEVTNFFVASDSADVVAKIKLLFPGRVISVKTDACDGREARCMQLALADMMLLGRTKLMLGSPWSSFTEGARRYGCRDIRVAGIDFAVDETDAADLPDAVVAMLSRIRTKQKRSENP